MSPRAMVRGRRFRFDLTLEVAAGVAVSGGELAELISDGLQALEARRLLFPGFGTEPGKSWLLETSIECTGYSRPSSSPGVDAAYLQLLGLASPRKAKGPAKLAEDLRDARDEVGAAILRLRMLQARLGGLAETLAESASALPETSAAAATTLAVATTILNTIAAELEKIE